MSIAVNNLDHHISVQVSDPKDKTSPTVPGRSIQRTYSDDASIPGASTLTGPQHSPRFHSSRQLERVYAGNFSSVITIHFSNKTIDFASNRTATAVGGKDFL